MAIVYSGGRPIEQGSDGVAVHQVGSGVVSQARNRSIAAAATTYASVTNSATWPSGFGVKEITVIPHANLTEKFEKTNYATAQAATTLVTGAGVLHAIVINRPIASATITVYDNTAASGTLMHTVTLPATLLEDGPDQILVDAKFSTGLNVTTTGTNFDVTFVYRALSTEPACLVVWDSPNDAVASTWLSETGGAAVDVQYDIVYPGQPRTFLMSSEITRVDVLPLHDTMRVILEAN